MSDIAGKPAIWWTLTRAAQASGVNEVWLACSDASEDDPLFEFVSGIGFPVYRGDENDVMGRFVEVARQTGADTVVRLTGDCPLVDPAVIDTAVSHYKAAGVDYVSNHLVRTYPDGLDVEVFSREALETANAQATDPFLREHVTPYIHGRLRDRLPAGDFTRDSFVNEVDWSHLRWTLDQPEDLAMMRRLIPRLPPDFGWFDVIAEMTRDPDLLLSNRRHQLHQGTEQGLQRQKMQKRRFDRSDQYFTRALETVPLASQTFSKSYQQWVKGAAPLFLTEGAGARVADLDGNVYIDYLQGLMANILGYGDPDVDAAVRGQLDKGVSFSLATPLEAALAERLVRLIPCAEMARFGKSGSDATSAAIRLARAHTGRDRVALCGYHGWHDWYIGTTTRNLGVPHAVSGLSANFGYNDPESLTDTLARDPEAFAAVILEPVGTQTPEPGFLESLRAVTERHGVLLVYDEIVSGFRAALGGAQERYGVVPDLACFGKAMANGMPISAVVGRREIMRGMEDIFFSGTFGGEALSIAAANATIDKLEREDVPETLETLGGTLIDRANAIFARAGLDQCLRFTGNAWWPRLVLDATAVDVAPDLLTSLWRQETVAHGLLLASSFNLCLPHANPGIASETEAALAGAVAALKDHLNSCDPEGRLRGEPVQPTFAVRA